MGLSIFTVNDVVFTFTSGVATQTGSNDNHTFLINSMSHCSILGNSFKSDDHIGTCPISHTTCVTPFSVIVIIMDIQVDFFRWQVPDLKEYLQHRGITCHLHRKHELVKLCELAQELDKYRIETKLPRNDHLKVL
jgi:hypothetical protein